MSEAEVFYMECPVCEKDTNVPDDRTAPETEDPHCLHCGTKFRVWSELTWDCGIYFCLEIMK